MILEGHEMESQLESMSGVIEDMKVFLQYLEERRVPWPLGPSESQQPLSFEQLADRGDATPDPWVTKVLGGLDGA